MPAQALAAAAVLVSFAVSGNHVDFKLDDGAARLTWYSPASFRFQRTLDPGDEIPTAASIPLGGEPVNFAVDDLPREVRLRSKTLEVALQKSALLVSVSRVGGDLLMQDMTEPTAARDGGVTWERAMPPGVRYYGLPHIRGFRFELNLDLRGKAITPEVPFLISSAGYGESHVTTGWHAPTDLRARFEFTGSDRYRVTVPSVDYFFHYGPTPKRIFERSHEAEKYAFDHNRGGITFGRVIYSTSEDASSSGWGSLGQLLVQLNRNAMASASFGGFNLTEWSEPPDLLQRARQIGSLVPGVQHSAVALSDFRNQLESFFRTYAYEAEQEGLPLWHPLPFQFPEDAEAAHHADEFMLGDEMLIAPIYTPEDKRSLYLPPGVWTNLATNEELQGRRTIEIETKGLPVFERNGTIVPLDSASGMALHYFPKLGAEFFILEKDASDWTQVHAAPAVDAMRLEIESKVARDYEWVVHHLEKPATVGFEEQKYAEAASRDAMAAPGWFYDAGQKNLHVRAHVDAGEDRVIHVAW